MGGRAYQALVGTAALCVLAVAAVFPSSLSAQTDPTTFMIRFHVAQVEGAPIVTSDWIDRQVANANVIFEPSSQAFDEESQSSLASGHERMETRQDRHALGAFIAPHVINVFIVESLRDVDEPDRMRMGVHWRPRGHGEGAHLVILSRTAGATVLAHELGHFFGNRRHPETPGNIMSYNRGSGPPFFDETQLRRIRRASRNYVRSRELRPH